MMLFVKEIVQWWSQYCTIIYLWIIVYDIFIKFYNNYLQNYITM